MGDESTWAVSTAAVCWKLFWLPNIYTMIVVLSSVSQFVSQEGLHLLTWSVFLWRADNFSWFFRPIMGSCGRENCRSILWQDERNCLWWRYSWHFKFNIFNLLCRPSWQNSILKTIYNTWLLVCCDNPRVFRTYEFCFC